jgi:hypothetical protein
MGFRNLVEETTELTNRKESSFSRCDAHGKAPPLGEVLPLAIGVA